MPVPLERVEETPGCYRGAGAEIQTLLFTPSREGALPGALILHDM